MRQPHPRVTIACAHCGQPYSAHVYRLNIGRGQFCGRNCRSQHFGVIAGLPAIEEMLRLMLPTMDTQAFADFVGIPYKTVQRFAQKHNIHKSNAWLKATRQAVPWPEDPGLREVVRLKTALVRTINKRSKELE